MFLFLLDLTLKPEDIGGGDVPPKYMVLQPFTMTIALLPVTLAYFAYVFR
jgi:hypothetical protein